MSTSKPYCSQFTDQNSRQLLFKSDFEAIMNKLLNYCRMLCENIKKKYLNYNDCILEYEQLVRQCKNKYHKLVDCFFHDSNNEHLADYNYTMHINSTCMKQNLIRMLKQQREAFLGLQKQHKKCDNEKWQLKAQREKLNQAKQNDKIYYKKQLGNLNQSLMSIVDDLKQQKELNAQLQRKIRELEDQLNMEKEIISHHSKNDISCSENNIMSASRCSQRSKSCLLKINRKSPSESKTVKFQNELTDEDFRRMLYLQALTIQEFITAQ